MQTPKNNIQSNHHIPFLLSFNPAALLVLASTPERKIRTQCYVCGNNASVNEQCVDEYEVSKMKHDIKNCIGTETEHGCVKSKFVDIDGTQIGKI